MRTAVAYRCGGSTGWPVRRAAGPAPCFPLNCPFARDEKGEHLERARVYGVSPPASTRLPVVFCHNSGGV
ncbi:hypothetical protein CBM2587_A200014 [Cupriavidus taiwanensis]|uniref:Uncharacterized protein n=1 Tax=Cupriavidus taiwanensis TaxID=164546 RepID=A0A375BR30_9BURK|nr:hypothetical protein CBM2587_A200014 [Cupriavidus taiwanensis]